MSVTIGFDTEAFLCTSRGDIVPMGGLILGTKQAPHKIHHAQDFFIQEDGVTIETNTPISDDPNKAHALLKETWDIAGRWVKSFLPSKLAQEMRNNVGRKIFDPGNVSIQFYSSYEFELEKLQLAGPGAFAFGCDPDFNAYEFDQSAPPGKGDKQNEAIDVANIGNVRFAGGHVHFGYDKSVAPAHVIVQLLDLVQISLGVFDRESIRAHYYGRPGCYRLKPYGLEYRTPTTGMLLSENGRIFLHHAHMLVRQPKKNLLFLYRKYYQDILSIPTENPIESKVLRAFLNDLIGLG